MLKKSVEFFVRHPENAHTSFIVSSQLELLSDIERRAVLEVFVEKLTYHNQMDTWE